MARAFFFAIISVFLSHLECAAQEKLFSGPQVGEKLPPFKVRGFFDQAAGKELDFVTQAGGKPIVLVFVHDFNRMSATMTRFITAEAGDRKKKYGLEAGVIWLADDVTEAEIVLKRSGHALWRQAPLGISLDGKEGPGSYGLNRNVTLTILVGKDGKVVANFPLVQPSLQADWDKIIEAIAKADGGPKTKLEDSPAAKDMPLKKPVAQQDDPKVVGLLRQIIQRTGQPEAVEKAATALEEYMKQNEAARKDVGRRASMIVNGGKVENYGIPKAQEYLRKWAKEYGTPPSKN